LGSVCALLASPVLAQDCPELVGRWPYGPAFAVAMTEGHAYLTSGSALEVVDVADRRRRGVVGAVALPGIGVGLAVSGHDVYVAAGAHGLRVVDVEDRQTPPRWGLSRPIRSAGRGRGRWIAFVGTEGSARLCSPASRWSTSATRPLRPWSASSACLVRLGGGRCRRRRLRGGGRRGSSGDRRVDACGARGGRGPSICPVGRRMWPFRVETSSSPGTTAVGFRVFDVSLPAMPRQVGFLEAPGRRLRCPRATHTWGASPVSFSR